MNTDSSVPPTGKQTVKRSGRKRKATPKAVENSALASRAIRKRSTNAGSKGRSAGTSTVTEDLNERVEFRGTKHTDSAPDTVHRNIPESLSRGRRTAASGVRSKLRSKERNEKPSSIVENLQAVGEKRESNRVSSVTEKEKAVHGRKSTDLTSHRVEKRTKMVSNDLVPPLLAAPTIAVTRKTIDRSEVGRVVSDHARNDSKFLIEATETTSARTMNAALNAATNAQSPITSERNPVKTTSLKPLDIGDFRSEAVGNRSFEREISRNSVFNQSKIHSFIPSKPGKEGSRPTRKATVVPIVRFSAQRSASVNQEHAPTEIIDRADLNRHEGIRSTSIACGTDIASARTPTRENARSKASRKCRPKDATDSLADIYRTVHQFMKDQNEHNKAMRVKFDEMEAAREKEDQRREDHHRDICRLLIDIRDKEHVPDVATENEIKPQFATYLLDTCCAMLKYIYALAGKGEIPAKYLYPTQKTQEELIHCIVRSTLELEHVADTESQRTRQDVLFSARGNFRLDGIVDSDARLSASENVEAILHGNTGSSEYPSYHEKLTAEVKAFLNSEIVVRNRITSIETMLPHSAGKGTKNGVKTRLLDQRRRFHDHLTTIVVRRWLQKCSGFEEFDTSLKTMKQDPKVFNFAAKVFEKDSSGTRPYMLPSVYGTAFCDALLSMRRACVDYADKALAQALKSLNDSTKVEKLCKISAAYVSGRISDCNASADCSAQWFYPHQLAFVQTKIHARLEWLSQCKVSGGKSALKPDRSHYGAYLKFAVALNQQVSRKSAACSRTTTAHHTSSHVSTLNESALYYVLGAAMAPLSAKDNKTLYEELSGDIELPVINLDFEPERHAGPSSIHKGITVQGMLASRNGNGSYLHHLSEEADKGFYDGSGGVNVATPTSMRQIEALTDNNAVDATNATSDYDTDGVYMEDESDYEEEGSECGLNSLA